MKFDLLSQTIEAARRARSRIKSYLRMRAFADHGRRRFRGDPRYDLKSVSDGFASRIDDRNDDTEILERICAAYRKALEKQCSAPERYQPTERWKQIERQGLGPVTKALKEQDIPRLRSMYRNFYRDPCSAGILGAPNGQHKAYFSGTIKDVYRHFYLSHVLCRLDYWRSVTNGKYSLRDLEGPGIGNPFGAVIDGTHIGVGAEYAHYCSKRIADKLDLGTATVAEIRGGFGGMAYYLLRNRTNTTYVDFDLPEAVALATYYLMKSFPASRFLCYGEQAITRESIKEADVVMLPLFELATVPPESVTLAFTSFGLAGMTQENAGQCVQEMGRMTREKILLFEKRVTTEMAAEAAKTSPLRFRLYDSCESGWHSYKVSGAGVGGAAGLADAAVIEQCYIRDQFPIQQTTEGADCPAPELARIDAPGSAKTAR